MSDSPLPRILVLGHTERDAVSTGDLLASSCDAEIVGCGADLSRAVDRLDSSTVELVVFAAAEEEPSSEAIDTLVSAAADVSCPVLLTGISRAEAEEEPPVAEEGVLYVLTEWSPDDRLVELVNMWIRPRNEDGAGPSAGGGPG